MSVLRPFSRRISSAHPQLTKRVAIPRRFQTSSSFSTYLRTATPASRIIPQMQRRFESTNATSAVSVPTATPDQNSDEPAKRDVPAYELTFTCKPCKHRSTHRVSKQGYHKGSVLITCPSCKNRHVISDHLRIFADEDLTIEDILQKKGETVQRGRIGTEGDIEFWDDGSGTYSPASGTLQGKPRLY
ncbi:hypothetical protein MMC25_003332 [Agyrium rufum]|nr:hypothetical protein [Agyrium rufum]